MDIEVKAQCEFSRWRGFGMVRCKNSAKTMCEGKHYCGMHDPVRRRERRAAQDEARQRQREARKAVMPKYTEAEYAALQAERDALREELAECFRLAGGDTDGELRPVIHAPRAVEVVRDLRECYDESPDLAGAAALLVAKWRADAYAITGERGPGDDFAQGLTVCAQELDAATAHAMKEQVKA